MREYQKIDELSRTVPVGDPLKNDTFKVPVVNFGRPYWREFIIGDYTFADYRETTHRELAYPLCFGDMLEDGSIVRGFMNSKRQQFVHRGTMHDVLVNSYNDRLIATRSVIRILLSGLFWATIKDGMRDGSTVLNYCVSQPCREVDLPYILSLYQQLVMRNSQSHELVRDMLLQFDMIKNRIRTSPIYLEALRPPPENVFNEAAWQRWIDSVPHAT